MLWDATGVERGKLNPSLQNIRRIARALTVPARDLSLFDGPGR